MKYFIILFLFLSIQLTVFSQNLTELKQQNKELLDLYNQFAKADASNKGAKILASKLVFLTNAITDFTKSQDHKTWTELKDFSEDLLKESKKYNSDNAKKLQKVMAAVDKNIIGLEPKNANDQKSEVKDEKKAEPKNDQKVEDQVKEDNKEEVKEEKEPKTEVSDPDIPLQQPESYKSERELIFYALFAVMALFLIILWISVNGSLKKLQENVQSKFAVQGGEIEHLEKVLVEGSMVRGEVQKFKDEYEKKLSGIENSTTGLFAEIDKKIHELDKKLEILDTTKANLAQLESLNVILHQAYVSKENLDLLLSAIHEKLKITDQNIRSQSVLSQVVQPAAPVQDIFFVILPDVIDSLDNIKKKTNIQQLKELIDNQLPLLSISKSIEDWNIHAIAKITQLCYVSSYNEGLTKFYDKLKEALKLVGFEIEDQMANRVAMTDFNAENISYDEYIGMSKVRTSEYPSYIAVRQEVENNLDYVNCASKTVLFVLSPTIFHQANGAKTLLRKGEYVIKM